ncbi:MAG: PQQ-binding-like beta-propeller repeat protein, partial [Planctomycetaceae bacterium]
MLLATATLVHSACPADQEFESNDSLKLDRSVLDDAVFQMRPQQRLLAAAQVHLRNGDYTAAFDVLHELLQQPYDSSRHVSADGAVHGTRSIALQSLAKIPAFARRAWSQSCQIPGTAALNHALQTGSRVALIRVAAEFPLSSVAADALITESVLALNTGQSGPVQLALRQLHDLRSADVLSRTQLAAIRKLEAAVDHSSDINRVVQARADAAGLRRLEPSPVWYWKENPWRHPQLTDALPLRAVGSQFDHGAGWQRPVVNGNAVIIRTPAGIARVDRSSGAQHWFLPFRSVVVPHQTDRNDANAIFEITEHPRQRLEVSGNVVFFVDGDAAAPIRATIGRRSRSMSHDGATHLVAVRAGKNPAVLWQLVGEHSLRSPHPHRTLQRTEDFEYAFEIPGDSPPSDSPPPDVTSTPTADTRLSGHRFLSAPREHGGRLYVTTHHDGMTWLNCLSATHGNLHWQQPLTWLELDADDDQHSAAIVGAITDETVVCLFADGLIAGCNPIDGRIEWMQSVLFHDEPIPETHDFWLAAVHDSRFIPQTGAGSEFGGLWMVLSPTGIICSRRGSRGISCLDTETGEVRWSARRRVDGGTTAQQPDLTCVGLIDSQLIMTGYGHCRAIHVADGSQTWVVPLGNHDGRISCDQQAVYVALNTGRLLTIDGNDGTVVHSQQLDHSPTGPGLVTDSIGIIEASAWSVRSWRWRDELPTSTRPDIDEALETLATRRLQEQHALTEHPLRPATHSVETCIAALKAASLSTDQQLRLAVVLPDFPGHHAILEDRLRSTPDELVELLPGWKLPLRTVMDTLGHSTPARVTPSTLNDSILVPARRGSLDSQLKAAKALINDHRHSYAELMLLNMSIEHGTPHAAERDRLLQAVRASTLAPGISATASPGAVNAKFHISPNTTGGFRLSDLAMSHQKFRLRTPPAVVPSWSQALFVTDVGPSPHVGLIDVGRGIESAWTSRSNVHFPDNVSYQDKWTSPGLVVVSSNERIGVISLLNDSPLTPLWL